MTYTYLRVSTDKQDVAQQQRTVSEWLARHNMASDKTITDEGISGGVSYTKRELGRTLLPLLTPGDVIITAELSRLGRSMCDVSKLVNDELKPRKARLIIVQMGLDLNCANATALDEMILTSFSFAAQLEKELIQTRTRSAMSVRRNALEADGCFVSKAGKRVTALGRPKGCDNTRATAASAQARTQAARDDNGNIQRWQVLSRCGGDYKAAAEQLNAMRITTATGLTFTAARATSTYHNLKKIFAV